MSKFSDLHQTLVRSGAYKGPFETPDHPLDATSEGQDMLDAIFAVHDHAYLDRFLNNKLSETEKRRIGLHFDDQDVLVRRTLSETGGTILTTDLALKSGCMAINLAGGTHHAHFSHGAGFCIINDLAVAARRAVQKHKLSSVMIFDLDVHQGDGTASIFADDKSVYTVSLHCESNYPFAKAVSDMDVPVKARTGDDEYKEIMRCAFQEAVAICKPELVIYDAGVDISIHDKLGQLAITDRGIFERDQWVLSECLRRRIPVAAVIGGGYDNDRGKLAARHSLLHRAAIAVASAAARGE